ncbi:uncharacterized protein LOC126621546 [Malus sylvestris]|uniref:uncharacterized protein LOC126621546 n=1 Tax=Malus sylvestris TaxID=3752 RepID=UPI0021ACB9A1|nr:uncharacterized protein LOC126621546 [Malus sylvestris]
MRFHYGLVMNSSNSHSPANSSAFAPHVEVSNPLLDSIASVTVHNIAIRMDDSMSLWLSLEKRFADASRIHIHSLCVKIQMIQKGDSSMIDYLNSITEISDKLAATGEPISEYDLIAYIIYGIPDAYESFVDSTETRNESVTSNELHGLLLSKEISLQKRKTRLTVPIRLPHFMLMLLNL